MMIGSSCAQAWISEEIQSESGYSIPLESVPVVCDTGSAYQPRNPEESELYGVVSGHLETFLERQRRRDRTVPRFVERELRSFLDCGILARGFLRVHCDACRMDRVVPFSCKRRGYAE